MPAGKKLTVEVWKNGLTDVMRVSCQEWDGSLGPEEEKGL